MTVATRLLVLGVALLGLLGLPVAAQEPKERPTLEGHNGVLTCSPVSWA